MDGQTSSADGGLNSLSSVAARFTDKFKEPEKPAAAASAASAGGAAASTAAAAAAPLVLRVVPLVELQEGVPEGVDATIKVWQNNFLSAATLPPCACI